MTIGVFHWLPVSRFVKEKSSSLFEFTKYHTHV